MDILVQLVTLNRLIEMFNRNILPVIYQQGSLGALEFSL